VLRLCLFTGFRAHQAQQGLQQGVVCRVGLQELDEHVQESPALVYDLVGASLAEGKHIQIVLWQRHALKTLTFWKYGSFLSMGPFSSAYTSSSLAQPCRKLHPKPVLTAQLQSLSHRGRHLTCRDLVFLNPLSMSLGTVCTSTVQRDVPTDISRLDSRTGKT